MQRALAIVLVLIGVVGLVLGRLGETTWAPETETTATVALEDPGLAVVIDPGVLYVGGSEGQVSIEGASDVSLITASNGDIEAYLEDTRYTRITGASDWTTLSTQEVNADGAEEISSPTSSDLWRSVETQPSPYTFQVADFWAGEHGDNAQPYRAILLVTDGTAPGADTVSITWPVDAENEWVPFAYAGGAAIAVIGLVLLVVSLGGGRRRVEDEEPPVHDETEQLPAQSAATGAGAAGAGAVGAGALAAQDEAETEHTAQAGHTVQAERTEQLERVEEPDPAEPETSRDDLDDLFGAPAQPVREQSVWSLGEPTAPEADEGAADESSADGPSDEPAGADDAITDDTATDDTATDDTATDDIATDDAAHDETAQESSLEDAPQEEPGAPVRLFGDDEERR